MEAYLFIAATVLLTVYGQLIIKVRILTLAADQAAGKLGYLTAALTDPGILSGFAAAFGASICWVLAIQRVPLSFAYPFVAMNFVLVPLASIFLFGERLNAIQFGGLALIVLGIVLVASNTLA